MSSKPAFKGHVRYLI